MSIGYPFDTDAFRHGYIGDLRGGTRRVAHYRCRGAREKIERAFPAGSSSRGSTRNPGTFVSGRSFGAALGCGLGRHSGIGSGRAVLVEALDRCGFRW